MQLVFLDESGTLYSTYDAYKEYEDRVASARKSGSPLPPYPFYVLAAVGIPGSHYSVIDDWFRTMKQSFLGAGPEDTGREYEISGRVLYALRQGSEPIDWLPGKARKPPHSERQKAIWRKLNAPQLEELERSVFDLCRRTGPVFWVIVVKQEAVYRKHRDKTWPPHYWALTYLQQRVAQFIQAQHGAYQHGIFVMDETTTLSTTAQFGEFLKVRESINQTASWPVNFRRHLVDVPVEGKSHLIQPLQLADVAAHTVWRQVHGSDRLNWFPKLEPFLAKHWNTGHYKNAGLTYIQ